MVVLINTVQTILYFLSIFNFNHMVQLYGCINQYGANNIIYTSEVYLISTTWFNSIGKTYGITL